MAAAPEKGPFRLIEAIEVAKAVWGSYHSDQLHWYIPEDLAELDKAAGNNPELLRDKLGRHMEV